MAFVNGTTTTSLGLSGSTITLFTYTPAAVHNLLVVFGTYGSDPNVLSSPAITDGTNTWTTVDDIGSNGHSQSLFSAYTITSTTAALTIVLHLTGTENLCGGSLAEYSGIATSSSIDNAGAAHAINSNITPGTGTNGVVSGTFTTTTNGDLLVCAGLDVQNDNTLTAGTSSVTFTGRAACTNHDTTNLIQLQIEDGTQTTAASGTQGAWTASVSENILCNCIAFKVTTSGFTGGMMPLLGVG